MKSRTFEMLEDMEEEESSSTSFTRRDTWQLMIHGLTMTTLMLQNSSKSSIAPPLWVDERYKYTPNSSNKSLSSNASKHLKNYYANTFYTFSLTLPPTSLKMYTTTTQGPHLIPLAPTLTPSPMQIPLPPSDTHTMASTC